MGEIVVVRVVEPRLTEVRVCVDAREDRVEAVLKGSDDIGLSRVVIHPERVAATNGAEVDPVAPARALLDK